MNSVIRYALIAAAAFMVTLLAAWGTIGTEAPYPGWLNVLLGAELSAAVINGWVAFGWKASKLVREQRERRENERERRPGDRDLREFRQRLDAVLDAHAATERMLLMPRYRVEMRRRISYQEMEPAEPQIVDGVRIFSRHLVADEEMVPVTVCAAHGADVPCPLCTPMDYYWRRP